MSIADNICDGPPPAFLRRGPAIPVLEPGEPHHVEFRQLAKDIARNRLDEIALLVRSLTYGEMMTLASALWSVRPEGKELDGETLAPTLHKWSMDNGTVVRCMAGLTCGCGTAALLTGRE